MFNKIMLFHLLADYIENHFKEKKNKKKSEKMLWSSTLTMSIEHELLPYPIPT